MATYLDSPNLPFSLHFPDAESPAVAAAARDNPQERRITYGAALTAGGDLEIETRALSAHVD